ncbi:MAG: hypothetical protein OHK0056_28040 [Bacteriovoracaceae bacterium]
MKAWFLLIFFSQVTFAQTAKIHDVIDELLHSTHQGILEKTDDKFSYSLYEIDSDQYFFVSNLTWKRFVLGKSEYRIGHNPKIFNLGIPDDALKGVLAHELNHTEDYVFGSSLGTILPIGVKVSFKKSRAQYERKTDLKVVLKGLGKELLAYKEWQYQQLTHEMLERKKREYLTPEEIRLIMKIKDQRPELMKKWLRGKIPANLEEMKKQI